VAVNENPHNIRTSDKDARTKTLILFDVSRAIHTAGEIVMSNAAHDLALTRARVSETIRTLAAD
jgi:hypothetical protein